MGYRRKFQISNFKFQIFRDNSKIILICLILFSSYLLYKNIVGSVFLKKKDRINVVFYGSNTVFYSLGIADISYFFTIPSNSEVEVPGGYGYYRIGALAKLVSLEKKPDLFRKTFSAISSSLVDLYFYPKENTIYYNENESQKFIPSTRSIFMFNSNANLVDRVFLLLFFLQKQRNQFKEIGSLPEKKDSNKALFNREAFFKQYQGFFYKKTYRILNDNVQILYTKNYKTALLVSNILEGEGIQVVDISQISNIKYQISKGNNCLIIEDGKKVSIVGNDLQKFFRCQFRRRETEVSDIILVLGDLEKEWEVD